MYRLTCVDDMHIPMSDERRKGCIRHVDHKFISPSTIHSYVLDHIRDQYRECGETPPDLKIIPTDAKDNFRVVGDIDETTYIVSEAAPKLTWPEARLVYAQLSQLGEVQVEKDYELDENLATLNLVIHVNDELYHEMEMIIGLDSIPNELFLPIDGDLDINLVAEALDPQPPGLRPNP